MHEITTALGPDRPGEIPFARPDIDEDDISAVVNVIRSGWITTGPETREFERSFAGRVGAKHAIALSSATAALHLALDAVGLRAGDEVIVPTFTFTACAEVVRYFDATPVLVDVEPDTLCVDPAAARAAVTARTRALMAVHLGGHLADMDPLTKIADAHGLSLIEDAAHGLPGSYRGRGVGTIGRLAAFSFYATKTITTGEGGMLVTDDAECAERARIMSLHGMSKDAWKRYADSGTWRYDVVAPGFKYNMTDVQAALGLSQLAKCARMWQRRAIIAGRYSRAFGAMRELEVPVTRPEVVHSWHLYLLRLHLDRLDIDRDAFIEELRALGIHASVHFIPIHTFTYYRETYGYSDFAFPVACAEFQRVLSLPIYSAMTDIEVDRVIDAVSEVVSGHRA
jgi:dTDP-4-amino-4,6-dideoxygalactose transaminase